MGRTVAVLLLFLAVGPSARSDTYSIAGAVVVQNSNGSWQRQQGIRVGLYLTEKSRSRKAWDVTAEPGLYSLVVTNVFGVDSLYILGEAEPTYYANPIKVDLTRPRLEAPVGVKIFTADDLILLKTQNTYTKEEAAKRIAAVANTERVKVQAGAVDSARAEANVARNAAQIAARAFTADNKTVPLADIHKLMQPHLMKGNLPKLDVLEPGKFSRIQRHEEYRPKPPPPKPQPPPPKPKPPPGKNEQKDRR